MPERFVSEPVEPVAGTADTDGMGRGEPGLPQRFVWRGAEYSVDTVVEKWKETSPCRNGANEQYVRKHWFKLRTVDGTVMTLYFERQPKSARQAKKRWWLFTVEESET